MHASGKEKKRKGKRGEERRRKGKKRAQSQHHPSFSVAVARRGCYCCCCCLRSSGGCCRGGYAGHARHATPILPRPAGRRDANARRFRTHAGQAVLVPAIFKVARHGCRWRPLAFPRSRLPAGPVAVTLLSPLSRPRPPSLSPPFLPPWPRSTGVHSFGCPLSHGWWHLPSLAKLIPLAGVRSYI